MVAERGAWHPQPRPLTFLTYIFSSSPRSSLISIHLSFSSLCLYLTVRKERLLEILAHLYFSHNSNLKK